MDVYQLHPCAMVYTGSGVRLSGLDWIALALVIVGAINWGLVGLGMFLEANWNLVDLLLGWSPTLEAIIYLLVGLAGLYLLYFTYELGTTKTTDTTARAD